MADIVIDLEALAREAAIAVTWTDAMGKRQRVSHATLRAIVKALGFPAANAGEIADSHARLKESREPRPLAVVLRGNAFAARGRTLRLLAEDGMRHDVPVSDGRVRAGLPYGYYRIADTDRMLAVAPRRAFQPTEKIWGVAVQLYALRGSPGLGDFGALGRFCEEAGRAGAGAVLLSPVHALPPGGISPYSPSSRLFLNPLYIPYAGRDSGSALIDWPGAAQARLAALRRAFQRFERQGGNAAFEDFVRAGGAALQRHASLAAGAAGDARFQLYLQWRADGALAAVQARARATNMPVGLISDVAVGIDSTGSEAADASQMLQGLRIGAPPDGFNSEGQDWGLTNFSPSGLMSTGYRNFLATLRAAMRHAGGIRLDHAMGMMRLWVVPEGMGAAEGAYLKYPFEELLGLLCLESQRHHALVIAEDLGTVPPAFRSRMRRAGLLGMEVLWFARNARGDFAAPRRWASHNAAVTSTHDLPTLAGWWQARDLDWRQKITGHAQKKARTQRARDKSALWKALQGQKAKAALPDAAGPFVDTVMAAMAHTPSPLTLVPMEDMTGDIEQPNLPGTITEYPNWRRRLRSATPFAIPAIRRRVKLLAGQS